MKKTFLKTFNVILSAAILLTCVSAHAADSDIKVTALKGNAALMSGESEKTLTEASVLKTGDVIKTAVGAEVSLTWGGNLVKIFPLSKFVITESSVKGNATTNKLSLESGKIFARAAKLRTKDSKFEIRTPTAIAGVRGSVIFVTSSADATSFQVVSGEFAIVGSGLDMVLSQNFQVDVGAGDEAASVPEPIPAAELQDLQVETEAIFEEAGVEPEPTPVAAPATESETESETEAETQAETQEALETEAIENTESSIDETTINNTITETATEAALELEAGTGGVNLTID